LVYKSFDIKDKLKALDFKFNHMEQAWWRPLHDVLKLSVTFKTARDVTLPTVLYTFTFSSPGNLHDDLQLKTSAPEKLEAGGHSHNN
jgi:hypothetical protein